jgi:hypothetical protein
MVDDRVQLRHPVIHGRPQIGNGDGERQDDRVGIIAAIPIRHASSHRSVDQSNVRPASVPNTTTDASRSRSPNENAISNGTPLRTKYRASTRLGAPLVSLAGGGRISFLNDRPQIIHNRPDISIGFVVYIYIRIAIPFRITM